MCPEVLGFISALGQFGSGNRMGWEPWRKGEGRARCLCAFSVYSLAHATPGTTCIRPNTVLGIEQKGLINNSTTFIEGQVLGQVLGTES